MQSIKPLKLDSSVAKKNLYSSETYYGNEDKTTKRKTKRINSSS